jgi:hypothetical protein
MWTLSAGYQPHHPKQPPSEVIRILPLLTVPRRSHPVGRLTAHDPRGSAPVRYILDPPTVVPPTGPFGPSDFFIVTCEDPHILFPVTCSFSLTKKPSCWSFKAVQLFLPPRNPPWRYSHPGWPVLLIGRRWPVTPCQQPALHSVPECITVGTTPIFTYGYSW